MEGELNYYPTAEREKKEYEKSQEAIKKRYQEGWRVVAAVPEIGWQYVGGDKTGSYTKGIMVIWEKSS